MREQRREYQRKWREANREKVQKASRAWREANRERLRAYREANRDKRREQTRRWKLMNEYGLTEQQYDIMLLNQGGGCAICGKQCSTYGLLSVDHNHRSGATRGLLCNECNNGIGKLKDDPSLLRKAAGYLEFHNRLDQRINNV